METTCTDTQSVRAKGIEIDYWLNIDVIDSELSGMPLKYRNDEEISASLGVNDKNFISDILYRSRKSFRQLTNARAKIDQ
jgi:hypothetical protein